MTKNYSGIVIKVTNKPKEVSIKNGLTVNDAINIAEIPFDKKEQVILYNGKETTIEHIIEDDNFEIIVSDKLKAHLAW